MAKWIWFVLEWVPVAAFLLFGWLAIAALLPQEKPGPLGLQRRAIGSPENRVAYVTQGQGPDVLLIHGGMGSAEDFSDLLTTLAADFRVTAVDRPGFGWSAAPSSEAVLSENALRLASLADSLGLQKPLLLGQSYGGAVALRMALDRPDGYAGLILLAPTAFPFDSLSSENRLLAHRLWGVGLLTLLGPSHFGSRIEGALNALLGPDRQHLPEAFLAFRKQLWNHPVSLSVHSRQRLDADRSLREMTPHYATLHLPAAIMGCDADPSEGRVVDSRRLSEALPQAELGWFHGCGHYLQIRHETAIQSALKRVHALASAPAEPEESSAATRLTGT